MDLDYPVYELINQEYEYVPWISDGQVEEITDQMSD